MPHFVTLEIITALEKEAETHAASMIRGNADDYATYRWLCGVMHGLNMSVEIAKNVDSKYEKDDDD